eukprot:SAG31_NODE_2938_length_4883_cov_21.311521_3_plen_58_part_00
MPAVATVHLRADTTLVGRGSQLVVYRKKLARNQVRYVSHCDKLAGCLHRWFRLAIDA